MNADETEILERSNYISFATRKRSGDWVNTPVWFAPHEGNYYLFSAGEAGKVKRLRNFSEARIATCTVNGTLTGDWFDGFPEEVLALDGERIALEGYKQPLSFNGNKVASFVLSPYPPGCCFGGMPGLDEWVEVEVAGDGVDYFAYRVIRVTGELEVGEELDDWGYVASLYRMNSDKVEKLW